MQESNISPLSQVKFSDFSATLQVSGNPTAYTEWGYNASYRPGHCIDNTSIAACMDAVMCCGTATARSSTWRRRSRRRWSTSSVSASFTATWRHGRASSATGTVSRSPTSPATAASRGPSTRTTTPPPSSPSRRSCPSAGWPGKPCSWYTTTVPDNSQFTPPDGRPCNSTVGMSRVGRCELAISKVNDAVLLQQCRCGRVFIALF